jgi:hypothetical protein
MDLLGSEPDEIIVGTVGRVTRTDLLSAVPETRVTASNVRPWDAPAHFGQALLYRVWRTQTVVNWGSGGRLGSGPSMATPGCGSGRLTLSCLVVSGTGIT